MNSFNPLETEKNQEKIFQERNDIVYQLLKNAQEMHNRLCKFGVRPITGAGLMRKKGGHK